MGARSFALILLRIMQLLRAVIRAPGAPARTDPFPLRKGIVPVHLMVEIIEDHRYALPPAEGKDLGYRVIAVVVLDDQSAAYAVVQMAVVPDEALYCFLLVPVNASDVEDYLTFGARPHGVQESRMVHQVLPRPFYHILIRRVEHCVLSGVHGQAYAIVDRFIPDASQLFAEIVPPSQRIDGVGAERYDVRTDAEKIYSVLYVVVEDIVQRSQVGSYQFRQDIRSGIPRRAGSESGPRDSDGEASIADSHSVPRPLSCSPEDIRHPILLLRWQRSDIRFRGPDMQPLSQVCQKVLNKSPC